MSAHPSRFEIADRRRLKPNKDNPKMITEADVAKMVVHLTKHGFRDPVEAREEDGLVLAGHRRLLAADKLGLTKIPVIWHKGMSDEQAAAYTIAHTRAEHDVKWNRSLLADQLGGLPESLSPDALGFSDIEVAGLFDLDRADEEDPPEGQRDEPPALVRKGEVWICGCAIYNVRDDLDNVGLALAEVHIKKLQKLLKAKAYLGGDEAYPFNEVMKERAAQP